MNKLELFLEQSTELPALPEIYLKISNLLESKSSDAYEIGMAVQTDPTLTGRILSLINSAYYGMSNQITSVAQAVSLLGRQQLKQILLGSVLSGVFQDYDNEHFSLRDFWEHSIKTAIIARHLAMQNANVIDHEAFFTAGLLHDLGRLIIAKVEPEKLVEIDDHVQFYGDSIVEVEADKLGVTHVEVGSVMMRKWRMPSMLSQCVAKHHETEHSGPFAMETSIVYLANLLSQRDLVEDEEQMQAMLSTIPNWQQTLCTPEQITAACQTANEQWQNVMESLGMADAEEECFA